MKLDYQLQNFSQLRDPTRVVIAKDGVVIQCPGGRESIPFDKISGIRLRDVSERGNVWAAVIIKRHQEKAIRLFRFREGSIAVCDALQAAWRSAHSGDAIR